jgi:rubrerythrin
MALESLVRGAFIRRLLSTPGGRAHVLSLMVAAEEGDEAGVFDELQRRIEEPRLRKVVARHQSDERLHASLFRECLERNGVEPEPVPHELMIIRRVAFMAGEAPAGGARTAAVLATPEEIVNTYALLLAVEQRGVQQFPAIGREFRRLGDHRTADVFDRVARDEARHMKYCVSIGRRYARDEAAWQAAVEKYRAIEDRAFEHNGLAGLAYAIEKGFIFEARLPRRLAARLRRLDPMCVAGPPRPVTAPHAA